MTTTTTAILDEFESELQASTIIPHCQIVNPPNLLEAQIKKMKPPYGFFIPQEKAEEVRFHPSKAWTAQEIEFEGGATTKGYLANHCRMVIIHRSGIEVQGLDSKNRYYYLGLAYQNGQITETGQQAKDSQKVGTKPMFRIATRMLVFFLGDNNELLHSGPLQFTSRGGFGGSFGIELREYYGEINRVFGKLKKRPGMTLSSSGLARVAIDFNLGFHKAESKAPFTCVKSRLAAAIEQVGTKKEVDRRGYSVELTGTPIESFLISGSSDTGKTLMQFHEDHKKFPLPNRGQVISSTEEEIEKRPGHVEIPDPGEDWNGEF